MGWRQVFAGVGPADREVALLAFLHRRRIGCDHRFPQGGALGAAAGFLAELGCPNQPRQGFNPLFHQAVETGQGPIG